MPGRRQTESPGGGRPRRPPAPPARQGTGERGSQDERELRDEVEWRASLLDTEDAVALADDMDADSAHPIPDALSVDPEVTVYADELADDENPLLDRLTNDPAHTPVLSGGDIDVKWDAGDAGDEAVGGTMPTPDQDNVDGLGEAAGLKYQHDEPLEIEKLEKRDADRWELDPASAEDYEERAREIARGTRRRPKDSA